MTDKEEALKQALFMEGLEAFYNKYVVNEKERE